MAAAGKPVKVARKRRTSAVHGPVRGPLTQRELERTGEWIAAQQLPSGEIPWFPGGKTDPWDLVHAAMGLTVAGRHAEAAAAFRFLARTQNEDGSWPAEWRGEAVSNATRETNHAAYLATGVWHLYRARQDVDLLAELWPTIDAALDFVVRMQEPCGGIAWALDPQGRPWRAPLLTGTSSIHGSLVCGVRIAERLGHDRPAWRRARANVARLLRYDMARFDKDDMPEPQGRHSMDWYYPVLGGALRGRAGREHLLDAERTATFIEDGVGCRCVKDRPWYTVAESCELALALDAVGLTGRARQIVTWMREQRTEDGGYWTGVTHPDRILWPEGEQTTWTAATVLLAHDALAGETATRTFFRDLAGDELGEVEPPRASEKRVATEDPVRLPSHVDDADPAFDV
jgi:hypothetical protein